MKKLISLLFLALVLVPLASASLNSHLISYYDFEQDTILRDTAMGIYNGTKTNIGTGTITTGIDGILGNAWEFNAQDALNGAFVNFTDSWIVSNNLNFTWSAWLNLTVGEQDIGATGTIVGESNKTDATPYHRILSGGTGTISTNGFSATISNGTDIDNGNWNHIVLTGDTNFLRLYVNGTEVSKIGVSNPDQIEISSLGAVLRASDPESFLNGRMDEVAIYNRTLSAEEVSELWNGGIGFNPSGLTVTLNSPANNSNQIGLSKNFNTSISPSVGNNLRNATLYIWNSTNNLESTDFKTITGTSINETIFESVNLSSVQTYKWNVFACENSSSIDHTCTFSQNNFTFTIQAFQVLSNTFEDKAIETSSQRFELNISINPGFSLLLTRLIYNGTTFTGVTSNEYEDNNFSLSKIINLPTIPIGTGSQNIDFLWNITTANQTTGDTSSLETNTYNQNLTELSIKECGTSINIFPILNFTFKDEFNESIISAVNRTTFRGTFSYGASSDNLIKNFSANNITESTARYNFCTNNESNYFYTDLNAFYTAENYADSNHFLNNASLNGSKTNEIDLFLLKENIAIQFFITIRQDLVPVEESIIQIAKFFPGDGSYKTVEIDKTDDAGKISAYLELDKEYQFTIIKNNQVLGVSDKTAICEAAPCEIEINLEDELENPFSGFDNLFATNILYNLSYSPSTKIITFDFVDTTGLATYFNLQISRTYANQSAQLISNQSLFTSSGSITFNMSGQPDGDYLAEAFVSRSPIQFIAYIAIVIAENARILGALGLFIALIILLTMIFGISVNPPTLILLVPLCLTFISYMGIGALSIQTLILTWVVCLVCWGVIASKS